MVIIFKCTDSKTLRCIIGANILLIDQLYFINQKVTGKQTRFVISRSKGRETGKLHEKSQKVQLPDIR